MQCTRRWTVCFSPHFLFFSFARFSLALFSKACLVPPWPKITVGRVFFGVPMRAAVFYPLLLLKCFSHLPFSYLHHFLHQRKGVTKRLRNSTDGARLILTDAYKKAMFSGNYCPGVDSHIFLFHSWASHCASPPLLPKRPTLRYVLTPSCTDCTQTMIAFFRNALLRVFGVFALLPLHLPRRPRISAIPCHKLEELKWIFMNFNAHQLCPKAPLQTRVNTNCPYPSVRHTKSPLATKTANRRLEKINSNE